MPGPMEAGILMVGILQGVPYFGLLRQMAKSMGPGIHSSAFRRAPSICL